MELIELYKFKVWADEICFDYIQKLTKDQVDQKIPPVNKSVKQLLTHLFTSQWGDFKLITDRDWSNPPPFGELDRYQIIDGIKGLNEEIVDFIDNNDLVEPITYNEDGYEKPIITSAEKVIFNFLEHTAYHRGQLAILLKYHGFEQIKQTNYSPYIWDICQN